MRAVYKFNSQTCKMDLIYQQDRSVNTVFLNDFIPPCVHPGTKETISSKKAWEKANALTGFIEDDGKVPSVRYDVDADNERAIEKAIRAAENGELRITEAQKFWARENDAQIKQKYGVDVSDVLKSKK